METLPRTVKHKLLKMLAEKQKVNVSRISPKLLTLIEDLNSLTAVLVSQTAADEASRNKRYGCLHHTMDSLRSRIVKADVSVALEETSLISMLNHWPS